jgi:hypothetical protein
MLKKNSRHKKNDEKIHGSKKVDRNVDTSTNHHQNQAPEVHDWMRVGRKHLKCH